MEETLVRAASACRRVAAFGFILALALLFGPLNTALRAQSLISGDIRGAVTDAQGAAVPAADVTATNTTTGAVLHSTTDNAGFYHFAFVPPGPYRIDVNKSGFSAAQRTLTVQVGQTASIDVQLQVSGVQQTVQVVEQVPVVQTDNADLTVNISNVEVTQLPNSGNDMTYIAMVSPGTNISTSSGYGNFSADGLPATGNLFTLNGQNDNDMYLNLANSGASNLMLGANEVSEATVVRNGYSGQYGQLPGANVNYITKSGTNEFHGNAAWFWNGRVMNANDFFNNAAQVNRPFENANQWFASLGGPIQKDKTFFFFDYEGLRNVLPTSTLVKIPSPQLQTLAINTLTSSGQTQAVSLYQKMFALYNGAVGAGAAVPVPGRLGGCPSNFTALGAGVPCAVQFRSTAGNSTSEDLWAARVDRQFGTSDKLFFRFWRDTGTQPTHTDPISPIFNDFSPQPQYQAQLSENHAFGAKSVNQFILSGFHYDARFGPPDENAVLAAFPTVIQFSPATFANMGGISYNFPQGRNVTQYQLVDDYSRNFTGHTLKVGVNFRRYDVSDLNFGILTHGRIIVSNLNEFINGGGTTTRLQMRFPSAAEQPLAFWQFGAYVQDDWRVTRNVTFNASLRADHDSNPSCVRNCFNRLSGAFLSMSHDVNQPYNAAISTGLGQAYPSVDAVTWQPRIGFAWTPHGNDRTVIRGGVGVFEYAVPGQLADSLARNTPGVISFTNIANGSLTPGAPGNLFDVANATYQALINGFKSGATFTQLKASTPTFATPSFTSVDGTLHTPKYVEWNFEVQHTIANDTVVSLNYVGNHGNDGLLQDNGFNAYCPSSAAATCGGFGLPGAAIDPRFSTVTVLTNYGYSNYDGLTVSLRRRMAAGLTFNAAYTWSHATDVVSNGGLDSYDLNTAASILSPENPYDVAKYNYGNADYDMRHYFNASYVWQDIVRRGFHGGPDTVFGGWTISGTLFYHTGTPFTVVDTNVSGTMAAFNFGGPVFAQQVGPAPHTCGKDTIDTPCFSDTAFTDPTGYPAQTRNQFYGPKYFDTDFNIQKEFKLHREGTKLALGFQFFNVLNHPNFDKPVNDYGQLGSGFGQIQSTVSPPTSIYGNFVGSAVSGRVIQTKIRLDF